MHRLAVAADPDIPAWPVDPGLYRGIMRNHAAAVTVIAVGPPSARTGLTATAVCSLSDDPPTALVCVNRSASAHPLIRAHRRFGINVLARGQEAIAERFAGMHGVDGEARFDIGAWGSLETGAPILLDALASLDCELLYEHESKTHSIFVGLVRGGRSREDAEPLAYLRGRFAGIRWT